MAVSPRTIPCRLDVPQPLRTGLVYALQTLLRPLGLVVDPVPQLPADRPALYYGSPDDTPRAEHTVLLHRGSDTIDFFAHDRLREARDVVWRAWDDERWPVLFGTTAAPDLVASAFYWLSGWQEWHAGERDAHGRFPATASLQAELGVLRRPTVDAYREMLAQQLEAVGLTLARRDWSGRAWAFCPTFDVDYVRKWRPGIVYREVVQYLLLNRRGVSSSERARRFGAAVREAVSPGDPYFDALTRIRDAVVGRSGAGTFYFKTAARHAHDVAYRLDTHALTAEMRDLQRLGFEVGLHPSYEAHVRAGYLIEERDRLAAWSGAAPRAVRQHYLRYDPARTSRLHEQAGFMTDSTLGFATDVGFRRGTCLPFRVFDVEAWRETAVWEMPLTFMDGALFVRLGLAPHEAAETTRELLAACRRFGGVGVGLWHNVLWDEEDYPGWADHFTATLEHVHEQQALIAPVGGVLEEWLDRSS